MLSVILLISALAMIVIPRIVNAKRRAKDDATRQMLRQLNTAMDEFEADIGCYPVSFSDLFTRVSRNYAGRAVAGTSVVAVRVTNADTLWKGPYMKGTQVPTVPSGKGSWRLVISPASQLGDVVIWGTAAKASDGSYYISW